MRISLLSESQENLPNDLSYAEASAEVGKSSFFIIVYPGNNSRKVMKNEDFYKLSRRLDTRLSLDRFSCDSDNKRIRKIHQLFELGVVVAFKELLGLGTYGSLARTV